MNISLFEDIRKEFSVDASGITYSTKRGSGRICGVKYQSWGQNGYLFNKELDEFIIEELGINCSDSQNAVNNKEFLFKTLTDMGLIVTVKSKMRLQDILLSLIIEFYATVKRTPEARMANRALRAIGLRTAIQEALGWQKTKSYEAHILAEPRQWTKVFEDDYYDQLARLSGLKWDKKTHRKPLLFAQLTKELVYDYLPKHIYDLIKKTQKLHGGEINKMHQFLDAYSLTLLRDHLQRVIYILSGETSLERAKQLIHQAVTKEYQHRLFG